MNSFERLEDEACKDGIDVISWKFQSERIKGLYSDGIIGINERLETSVEKTCTLAEELGHHHTSVGNIIDMENVSNRKQERQARIWGYNKLIGLNGIIQAFEAGCQSAHEAAEYLEVTEEYLNEAVECYRDKYGACKEIDNYIIYFIPNLAVIKMV